MEPSTVRLPIIGKCRITFDAALEYLPPPFLMAEDGANATDGRWMDDCVDRTSTKWALTDIGLTDDFFSASTAHSTADADRGEKAGETLQGLVSTGQLPFLANVAGPPYTPKALMEQLLSFAKHCCVAEDAATAVLLTPEFVHYLGYQRLLELNANFLVAKELTSAEDASIPGRASIAVEDTSPVKPSASPWEDDAVSVAASAAGYETTVPLLKHLSTIVGGSWKSLTSTAMQTSLVLPGINPTTPYVDAASRAGAQVIALSHERDSILGWVEVLDHLAVQSPSPRIALIHTGETAFGRGPTTVAGKQVVRIAPHDARCVSPHHFSIIAQEIEGVTKLNLLNFGLNGTTVATRHRWVIGDVVLLNDGDELVVDKSYRIIIHLGKPGVESAEEVDAKESLEHALPKKLARLEEVSP